MPGRLVRTPPGDCFLSLHHFGQQFARNAGADQEVIWPISRSNGTKYLCYCLHS